METEQRSGNYLKKLRASEFRQNARTHQNEKRRNDEPTNSEEKIRIFSGHVLDVGRQPLGPVAPDDGSGLEEGNVHQGEGRGVVVNNLEPVNAALETKIKSDCKIEIFLLIITNSRS